MWTQTFENKVLNAFNDAFTTTLLNVRVPNSSNKPLRVGYHDGRKNYVHMLCNKKKKTIGKRDWFFYPTLVTEKCDKKWKSVIIGGELRPELQSAIFSDDYNLSTYAQNYTVCVETTKASYMINSYAFSGSGYTGTSLQRAKTNAQLMGYAFVLQSVDIGTNWQVNITLSNNGVASFYYPIFPYLKFSPGKTKLLLTDISLQGINALPGTNITFSIQINQSVFADISSDTFVDLIIGVKSPYAFSSNPVKLCNKNASADGSIIISNAFYVSDNSVTSAYWKPNFDVTLLCLYATALMWW
ncbi:hypothetical protein RFI_33151 [Reticulomyxa filosa]|uniref:Uncharacterized protein n=1 Tax=Reticulomyxa filosa TaxID=46433 RepID=X6LS81_RETFI|nr:hypothetical protein RFI_33151 [Reticulomyxa filosa]|eukprot:ETO04246.1 hypothetical protein RFI_33151 [Reticulomyxa filosa]